MEKAQKAFVVKVPGINGLGKTKGCEGSGNAVLKVLKEEIYSSEVRKSIDFNAIDLEEIHLDNSDLVKSGKLIYKNAFETDPISAFGGMEDNKVSRKDLEAWAEQTCSRFRFKMFPGDHFFLKSVREQILLEIVKDLEIFLGSKIKLN